MLQKLTLIGALGRDPEIRQTQSGQAVTSMSVACTEKWNGQDGQLQERTLWFRVSVWGKQAESCNQYLKKGSKVYIEGRLVSDDKGNPRMFTRQDGTAGTSFEVSAQTVKFLSPARNGESSQPTSEETDNVPF